MQDQEIASLQSKLQSGEAESAQIAKLKKKYGECGVEGWQTISAAGDGCLCGTRSV